MTNVNKIKIFDTSLRDGAQTPWVNMTPEAKIEIAKKLDEFWVDYIEAGFPISSPWDFIAVKEIWQNVKARVYWLARANQKDIDAVYEALENWNNRWIHTFIGTSPIHMEYKLNMSEKEVLESISKHVSYARQKFNKDIDEIMFSAEDALRTKQNFLFDVIYKAIKAGATQINIPDTVWFSQNFEIYELTKSLIREFWNKVEFSIHTHNDLWQAVSNSLAFIKAWWTIVQWTFPPAFWERAWNADLAQILMNIKKRPDYYWVSYSDNIEMEKLYELVKTISEKTWKRIPENYPIIWRDVYNHSSWIHQDWANKNKWTYEIISPEEIWYKIENSFILTNQSWRAWLENAIKSYFWIDLEKEKLNEIFEKFKLVSSENKSSIVTMDDIREILIDSWIELSRKIEMKNYFINLDIKDNAKAAVELLVNWKAKEAVVCWKWPVEAIYNAIIKASNLENINLVDFSIKALTSDPSAHAKVSITIEKDWKIYEEFGVNTDIVKASIQAFINCIDRISLQNKKND